MGKRIVTWDEDALHDFISILNYIKKDSPANANKVKKRIQEIVNSLPSNPAMFRVDELKIDNDGTFRVFSKNKIRISYKIESESVFIVRVRHSSQEPLFY